MSENEKQLGSESGRADAAGVASADGGENELEAEQESAEAMDAEVPQPPDASETTEGGPS
ncbi:MAG: hypothetical protein WCD76_17930 [Pyrinomonadaceae bacterium]